MVISTISILFAMIPASAARADEIDREALVQLIQGAQAGAGYSDVSFEFEGQAEFPEENRRADRDDSDAAFSYSGTYAMRSDGARRAGIYFFNHLERTSENYVVCTLGSETTVWIKPADAEEAKVTIAEATRTDFQRAGCFGQILEADEVIELARGSRPYEFVGFERLDGARCAVARFYRAIDMKDKEKAVSETYWIDLERGGYVLRHEHRWGRNLARLTTDVRLESFDTPSGRSVWLPVHGQEQGHVTRDKRDRSIRVFPRDPVYVESYDLVKATLRFDQSLTDDYFTVKPRKGDLVSDQIKQAEYEYGQYVIRSRQPAEPPPSDAEIEAGLESMLKDSDFLNRELKATSVARRGPTWSDRAPWLLAGSAVAALAVVSIRRRMAA